jgi:short-subunit dehydrogenase
VNQDNALRHRYGPWAVVTGASDGIGRAFAERLAASGVSVVLVARRRDRLEALADALSARHGVQTRVVPLDLGDPGAPRVLLDATAALDVGLYVAAAGYGLGGAALALDPAAQSAMVDVNCRAIVETTLGFAARFAAAGRGGIVLLSSLVAFQGVPRASVYAATKAFVQSFAEGLRIELAPRRVDVLAVAPGPVASGFGARAGMTMGLAGTPETVARVALGALGRRTTTRPGALAWLLEGALSLLPRVLRVRVLQRVMAGMTPEAAPHALPTTTADTRP